MEDWIEFYQPSKGTFQRTQVTGILDCFCKANFKKLGPNLPFTEFTDNDGHKIPVCAEWMYDFLLAKGINLSISVALVAVNFVLKVLLIRLIASIGEDTKSA